MILHALTLDSATGQPATTWWAVHAETLTPIRIDRSLNRVLQFEIVAPPPGEPTVFASHPQIPFNAPAIAKEVFLDIQRTLFPGASHFKSTTVSRADIAVPEYLLVFTGAGEQPAIFRSTDPHLIIPANPEDESILGQPLYWRSATDLPATGWEYWWTDCQLALDRLAPQFIHSASLG